MNYSGVLVSACPDCFEKMLKDLESVEGVEVHQQDPEHNRCIVVIEAEDVSAEVARFKAVSELSSVIDAALIVHNFEDSAIIDPIQNLDSLQ